MKLHSDSDTNNQTNCSMLSQLPLKCSGQMPWNSWWLASSQHVHAGEDGTATAIAAWEATLATSSGASITQVCKLLLVTWAV